MSSRSLASRFGIVVGGVLIVGCGAAPDEGAEVVADVQQAIKGGYVDETDTSVVGIYDNAIGGICSGSLLAPNVVLTARHCVSDIENEVSGGVSCHKTTAGPPHSARSFFVTTKTDLGYNLSDYHRVREVITLPVAPDAVLCGNDQAILILDSLIDPSEAAPLVPRVDIPVTEGEQYYAVGYGATQDGGAGSGTRRRRDTLFVDCVTGTCPTYSVKSTEWVGDQGICSGDSGGPAFDLLNRVVGVTSRGSMNCDDPVYGDVYSWAQWIKDTTIYAAGLGGYAPPPWSTGYPTDPAFSAAVGGPCTMAEECPAGACLANYCTRPCNELAACPEGYTCGEGSPSFCVKIPPKKKKKKAAANDDGSEVSCSFHPANVGLANSAPWTLAASALGALALLRRRRSGR